MVVLSVIIPFYNVSPCFGRCIHSLMSQTIQTGIEYIFVNDGSTDDSKRVLTEIISQFPNRLTQVRYIELPHNMGVSTARTVGMHEAKGEYIIHCDSDDWVSSDAYQYLVDKISDTRADIILTDFYLEEEANTLRVSYPEWSISQRLSTGLWWMLWSHAVKRSLLIQHDLHIESRFNFWEDMDFLMRVYHFANDIAYLHKPIYHYDRRNPSALTRQHNDLSMLEPCLSVINHLTAFYQQQNVESPLRLMELKRSTRDLFLRSDPVDWNSWLKLFPDSWHYLWHDSRFKFCYRLVYTMASRGLILPLRLYMFCSNHRRK